MFFHYNHIGNGRSLQAIGGTDALGQPGPAAQSLYSFAEGYVNLGYDEWLTLQNPTASVEVIWVTLENALGHSLTFSLQVNPHSRATVDIVGAVLSGLYHNGDGFKGFEVSMVVQTTSVQGGPFVAERPMYWNAAGTQGGSNIIGFSGTSFCLSQRSGHVATGYEHSTLSASMRQSFSASFAHVC